MTIPKGLLVAAGIGAVGVGAYMFMKGGDKPEEGADPASKDPTGAGMAGVDPTAATGTTTPTAATPGLLPGAGAGAGGIDPQAAGGAGALPAGAQQVGPYTVIPDAQTGMSMVFETATQQPVGVLDQQGNLQPITVDAQGNMSIAPGTGAGAGSVSSSPVPTGTASTIPSGVGAPASQASAGASQYTQLAEALFAGAGDGSVGAARSDAIAGPAALAPAATATSPVGAAMPNTAMTAPAAAGSAAPAGSQQVGPYTIIPDPASGAQVVFETATRQPVGVLDQSGNLVPIEALQGGAASGMQGSSSMGIAPAPVGSAAPVITGSAMPAPIGAGY